MFSPMFSALSSGGLCGGRIRSYIGVRLLVRAGLVQCVQLQRWEDVDNKANKDVDKYLAWLYDSDNSLVSVVGNSARGKQTMQTSNKCGKCREEVRQGEITEGFSEDHLRCLPALDNCGTRITRNAAGAVLSIHVQPLPWEMLGKL